MNPRHWWQKRWQFVAEPFLQFITIIGISFCLYRVNKKKYINTLSSYLSRLNFRMVGIQFPIFQLQKSKRTSKLYLSVVSDIRLFFCLGSWICVYLCKIALRSGICWNLMALLSSFSIALWVISLTVVWWRFNTSLS